MHCEEFDFANAVIEERKNKRAGLLVIQVLQNNFTTLQAFSFV